VSGTGLGSATRGCGRARACKNSRNLFSKPPDPPPCTDTMAEKWAGAGAEGPSRDGTRPPACGPKSSGMQYRGGEGER
jgi:hypothetical protein